MSEKPNRKQNTSRRKFISGALIGAAGCSLAMLPSAKAANDKSAAKRKGVFPKEAPAADVGYSPGLVAEGNKVVFVSGQGPRDLTADMETQFRQTFEKIGAILKEAGASFENVVMVRSYLVNVKRDLPVLRKVRKEFLVKPYPASTAVGTTELAVPGLQLEIEAVAIL